MSAPVPTATPPGIPITGGGTTPTVSPTDPAIPTEVPAGTPSQAVIGPQGGSLASSDGALSLDVPAGALAADTTIAVQPLKASEEGDVGTAYLLTPDKLTFAKPVQLTFHLSADQLSGSALEAIGTAYQLADGSWQDIPVSSVDDSAGTVTLQTSHFSKYKHYYKFFILPASKSLPTSSETSFSVMATQVGPKNATPQPIGASLPQAWSVNGIPGGDDQHGKISVLMGSIPTYQAPAKAPKPDTVYVSDKITRPGAGAVTLVVPVKIIPAKWALVIDQINNQQCVSLGSDSGGQGGTLPLGYQSDRTLIVDLTLDDQFQVHASLRSKAPDVQVKNVVSCTDAMTISSASLPPDAFTIDQLNASFDSKGETFTFSMEASWVNLPAFTGMAMGRKFSTNATPPISLSVPAFRMPAKDGALNSDSVITPTTGNTQGPVFTLQVSGQ